MAGEGSVLVIKEEAGKFTDLIMWLPKKITSNKDTRMALFSGAAGRRKVTL